MNMTSLQKQAKPTLLQAFRNYPCHRIMQVLLWPNGICHYYNKSRWSILLSVFLVVLATRILCQATWTSTDVYICQQWGVVSLLEPFLCQLAHLIRKALHDFDRTAIVNYKIFSAIAAHASASAKAWWWFFKSYPQRAAMMSRLWRPPGQRFRDATQVQ